MGVLLDRLNRSRIIRCYRTSPDAIQLAVVTRDGEHLAVELRADLLEDRVGAPFPQLDIIEKAEWHEEGGGDA